MGGNIHIDIARYTQKLLVIKQDRSVVELLFGGLMLFFALWFIYKVLTNASDVNKNELLVGLVLILLLFGIFAYLGLYFIVRGSESIVVEMNKETGKGTYVRKGLLTNECVEFDLNEINGVYVVEHCDLCFASDFPYCMVTISTKNREFILFSYHDGLRLNFFEPVEQVADETTDFLNIPRSDVAFIP
jgi:hypothetical protein